MVRISGTLDTACRTLGKLATRPTNNMVDLTALLLAYAGGQGLAGTLVPRLLDVV